MKYLYAIAALVATTLHAAPPTPTLPDQHYDFLDRYCLDCHDSDTQKGKVNLEDLAFEITTLPDAELWQKVLNTINSKEMPPEDKKQPDDTEKADFLSDLADTMVLARKSLSDSGGEITMRRLNRREYQNTIKHLTGISVDVNSLPADGGGRGTFDTEGASQFISSDQFEQYLKLGRKAVDEMFARRVSTQAPTRTIRVEPEHTANVTNLESIKTIEEKLALVKPWMEAIDAAVKDPANEAILAQLRKDHPKIDDHPFLIYRKAKPLKGVPELTHFGGDPDSAMNFYQLDYHRKYASLKHYAALPHNDRGTYLKQAVGVVRLDIATPKDEPELTPGKYHLRFRAGVVEGSDPDRHFIDIGHPQRVNQVPAGFANPPISRHQVHGTIEEPQIIETVVEVTIDGPKEFGIQERMPASGKARLKNHYANRNKTGYGAPPALWVDWIELEGPISEQTAPASKTYRVEPELTINPANEKAMKSISDEQARYTQWKAEVDKIKDTPENQAIIAELAKKNKKQIEHPLHFYRFADKLVGAPDAKDYGFIDSAKAFSKGPAQDRHKLAYHKHFSELPHRDRGTWLKLAHGVGRVVVAPEDLAAGSYTLRISAGAHPDAPATRRHIDIGHPQREIPSREKGLVPGQVIASRQVTGTPENPQIIEIPIEIGIDTIREFAVQEKQPNNGDLKALWDTHNAMQKENGYGIPPSIWIDWIELEGPHSSSAPKRWKNHREVEDQANRRITGVFDNYFKRGHDAGKVFLETGEPQPKAGVNDQKEAEFRIRRLEREGPTWQRYLDNPLTQTGSLLTIFNPHREEFIPFPPQQVRQWKKIEHEVDVLPAGDYKVRFRIGAIQGSAPERHFVDIGMVPAEGQFNHLATYQVTGTTATPQIIEAIVSLAQDGSRLLSIREKRDQQHDIKLYNDTINESGLAPAPALWIDWVEWEGPIQDQSQQSSFSKWWVDEAVVPDETQRARQIVEQFARSAFRDLSPGEDYIDRLVSIFQTRRAGGDEFNLAIRTPLSIILASPGFLYLNEPTSDEQRRPLDDRELAVRLAYFLWSAPPDDQLLSLAQTNELNKPEILRQQVDRLLADTRADEFVSGFVHQWLDMERLDFFQFDTTLYRDFDESTRSACRQEVYHSFAYLLRNSQPLAQLLKSDYVFINGLLGSYYGIEGITGDEFRKVALPAGSPRGGLLGMAAIHAMGSDGIESSPVERGAWVLRHLLHNPPPPAPPNVPQLSRLADKPLTTREKLAAHMEEAQCASCHRKIDPIGFGLENFDAAGKWRTQEGRGKNAHTIDPAGAFHNGPAFADYYEMRDIIALRKDDFARGFAEHLIGYALGRPFGFTDKDLADEVVDQAKASDYSVSEFIHALVESEAFQSK